MKAAARIRLAAPLDPNDLPAAVAARVTESVESGFDPVAGAVLARRRRRLGALVLSDRTEPADPAETAAALARAAAARRSARAALDRSGAPAPGPGRPDARRGAGRLARPVGRRARGLGVRTGSRRICTA